MTDSEKNSLYKFISDRIGYYLKIKNVKQFTLANETELKRATLSKIISGSQPVSIHILFDIAKSLNLELADFLPPTDYFDIKKNDSLNEINNLFIKENISTTTQNQILTFLNNSDE